MKAKIIKFPRTFKTSKTNSLTPLMINTLLDAFEKQQKQIPFGQRDIKGSFGVLINRGLIIREEIALNGKKETTWQVTKEAVGLLKAIGLVIDC